MQSSLKRKTAHYVINNGVKFIYEALQWHIQSSRVKDAFLVTLHPDNINTDSGMEIPEGGISMVEKHNSKRTRDNICPM